MHGARMLFCPAHHRLLSLSCLLHPLHPRSSVLTLTLNISGQASVQPYLLSLARAALTWFDGIMLCFVTWLFFLAALYTIVFMRLFYGWTSQSRAAHRDDTPTLRTPTTAVARRLKLFGRTAAKLHLCNASLDKRRLVDLGYRGCVRLCA